MLSKQSHWLQNLDLFCLFIYFMITFNCLLGFSFNYCSVLPQRVTVDELGQ